jgi:hypothetical protein
MVRQIAVEPVCSTWFKRNLALVVEALHALNKLSTNSYIERLGSRMILSLGLITHVKLVFDHEDKLLQLVNVDVLFALNLFKHLRRCARLPSSDLTTSESDDHTALWIK